MALRRRSISLGMKIFSIPISMLLLLVVVALSSYHRLSQVNHETIDLGEYLLPIGDLVTEVDVHGLEQEIHFVRILKLYEVTPPHDEQLAGEFERFAQHGAQVDEKLEKALALSRQGMNNALEKADREEFVLLEPMLDRIEREHQDFHDHALQVIALLEAGKKQAAYRLEQDLEAEKDHFDREIEALRLQLQTFNTNAARASRDHQRGVLRTNVAVTVIAIVIGIVCAWLFTAGVMQPVRQLMRAMREVGRGNLAVQVQTISRDEIGLLAGSFRHMVDELLLKEKIKDTFGKYVDPRVVESLIHQPQGVQTGGDKRVMTVMFADIDAHDAVVEKLTPDAIVRLTNRYLGLMSEPVSTHRGVIDKFIDTMVMAFWGPPFTSAAEHAILACCAALDQIAKLADIHALCASYTGSDVDVAQVDLRIGILTGALVVGNMGSEQSKSYTVLGDTVNIASRLQGASKQYGTRTMMTEDTQKMVGEMLESREIDVIQVLGKEEPVRVFELLGRQGDIDPPTVALRDTFAQGLQAYRSQAWEQALVHFQTCLSIKASDGPAAVYLSRVRALQQHPPGDDWDGVWRLTKK
ncbi:MAG: adenylate/guanylate cyclase domain-containing protein [Candidatus Tectomicrobia bacterium]